MLQWLRQAREVLAESVPTPVLVSGNESADLDSIVSAVALSYFLYQINSACPILPIVCAPRASANALALPYSFLAHLWNSTPDEIIQQLIFSDDLPAHINPASVILVDHNHVTEWNKVWWEKSLIAGVIDHHDEMANPLKSTWTDSAAALPNFLGSEIAQKPRASCSILIAEIPVVKEWLVGHSRDVDGELRTLLQSLYLCGYIDGHWFENEEERGVRWDNEDIQSLEFLESLVPQLHETRRVYKKHLKVCKERHVLAAMSLPWESALRQDFKALSYPGLLVHFSSLQFDLRSKLESENSYDELVHAMTTSLQAARSSTAKVFLITNVWKDAERTRQRTLLVFSPTNDKLLLDRILEKVPEGVQDEINLPHKDGLRLLRIRDTVSRKRLIPIFSTLQPEP